MSGPGFHLSSRITTLESAGWLYLSLTTQHTSRCKRMLLTRLSPRRPAGPFPSWRLKHTCSFSCSHLGRPHARSTSVHEPSSCCRSATRSFICREMQVSPEPKATRWISERTVVRGVVLRLPRGDLMAWRGPGFPFLFGEPGMTSASACCECIRATSRSHLRITSGLPFFVVLMMQGL